MRRLEISRSGLPVTRLRTEEIAELGASLAEYDAELLSKTGCTLRDIACRAAGVDDEEALGTAIADAVAAVPMSSGLGVLEGFAEGVRDIAAHIGFESYVTEATDVAGLAEAARRRADVIMVADDDDFVAINLRTGCVVDNAEATGRGYAAALNAMAGGLEGRGVLVIGCGRVGSAAAATLLELGAEVCVYDIDPYRSKELCAELGRSLGKEVRAEQELDRALAAHECIMDASPAADIIDAEHVSSSSIICAPGVPHGLTPRALKEIAGRFLHDPLQIGVATMVIESFLDRESRNDR